MLNNALYENCDCLPQGGGGGGGSDKKLIISLDYSKLLNNDPKPDILIVQDLSKTALKDM